MPRQRADHDVVEHAQSREWAHDLERAREPELADRVRLEAQERAPAEADLSRVRRQETGEQIEGRRLAGAVGPDEAEHLALGQREVETGDGVDAAEVFRESARLEQAHAVSGARRRRSRARRGYAPSGRKSTTAISRSPYTTRGAPCQPPWATQWRARSASRLRMKEPRIGPSPVPGA